MSGSGITFGLLIRALLAVPAGVMPRRITSRWEAFLPVRQMSWISGLFTMAGGFTIGVPGFLNYAADLTLRNNKAVMEAVQAGGGGGSIPVPVGFNIFAPFFFALTSPPGILASYLLVSGLVRTVNSHLGDPQGDPILTNFDRWLLGTKRGARETRARRERELLEGRDVPDRLLPGAWAGLAEATFVLVASRRKQDWEEGLMISSGERWYRLGKPFDRELPAGLRTLYPLTEVKDIEVLRRWITCDLPPLTEIASKEGG